MHLRITGDTNEQSGVDEIVDEISGPTRGHFMSKNYGAGLLGVVVVLMCRNPELDFKRRLRFARKEKTVFMDIMLDLDQMRQADRECRRRVIFERLLEEIPAIIRKYSITDFDDVLFTNDLQNWLNEISAK